MRVFAGPNGSGKSTVKDVLPPEWLGVYLNADDLEKSLRNHGVLDPSHYRVPISRQEALDHLRDSALIRRSGLTDSLDSIRSTAAGQLDFSGIGINSYLASAIIELVRWKLLQTGISFTFETVMSSPDKVAFLETARAGGYRTYLYYIATEDPDINVSRVSSRVQEGGHDVPVDRIVSRYHRSLDLLFDAIRQSDRAYVFDNSGENRTWVAEIEGGKSIEIKTKAVPAWFEMAVLRKLGREASQRMPGS